MSEPLFTQLIDNDPLKAKEAVKQLVSSGVVGAELVDFIQQNIDPIYLSPTARHHLAKLSGSLAASTVPALIDCLKDGELKAKLVAAQCMHYVTDPQAHPKAEGAMLKLVDGDDRAGIRGGMEALGHLRAVRSGPRIWDAAKRDASKTVITHALVALFRLIASEDMDEIVGLRFGYFNDAFRSLHADDKPSALSVIHFILPEFINRMRDRSIDMVMQAWVAGGDKFLRMLGADTLATLRIGRVRKGISDRINELAAQDDNDESIPELAAALGRIGVNDDASLITVRSWYGSNNEQLRKSARLALAFSFPAMMATDSTRNNRFLRQFASDVLEESESELQANVILGLALTRKKQDSFIDKLGSMKPIIRSAAAIAVARNASKKGVTSLRQYTDQLGTGSFERIIALSAMARVDRTYANELHTTLCKMQPLSVWHIRHGISPRLFNPTPWMSEIIGALRAAGTVGNRRADAWAEALMFKPASEPVEPEIRRTKPAAKRGRKGPKRKAPAAPQLGPGQLLTAMSPTDWSGLFVIGSFDRRVTFYNQQVRALNLIKALFDHEDLLPGYRLGVVGAGAAGITAAMAAAKKGCEVTLYEKAGDVLNIQAHSNRFVHPHMYEWPEPGSFVSRAGLPFLDWHADEARKVVKRLRREFKKFRADAPDKIEFRNMTTVENIEQIEPIKWGEPRIRLTAPNKPPEEFHAVILAIGFGLEQRTFPDIALPSYWDGDQIQGPERKDQRFLISGAGDGGLIDLARATLDFHHQDYFDELEKNRTFRELAEQMLRVDKTARRRRESKAGVDLMTLYDGIRPAPDAAVEIIKARKRPDTVVTFNHPEGVFSLDSALTGRLLGYLIIKAGLVTCKKGKIGTDPDRLAESRVLKENFEQILLRHGPDRKHFAVQFPALADACKELKGKLAELDLTRKLDDATLTWFGGLQPLKRTRARTS